MAANKAKWIKLGLLLTLILLAFSSVPLAGAQDGSSISVFTASQPAPFWMAYTGRTGDATFIYGAVHCSLVDLDNEFNVVSDLASSYEVSEDGMTYTFNLNPDARWHDGEAVTAADVEFSWVVFATPQARTENRTRGPVYLSVVGADAVVASAADEAVTGYADTASYEGIEIIDDNTIAFTLTAPNPLWILDIASGQQNGFILPKHLLQDVAWNDYPTHPLNADLPVGCGAYEVTNVEDGQFVELSAFADYHLGAPSIDTIFVKSWLETPVAAAQLESGETDIVLGLSLDDAMRLGGNDDISILTTPASNAYQMSINLVERDLDQRVREAMVYAIDREGILTAVFNGLGAVNDCCLFQDWAIPEGQTAREFNPDRARELVEAAVADGAYDPDTELSILYPVGYRYSDILLPIVQQQWADVGIQSVLDPREDTAHRDALFAGEWDLWYNQSANMLPDPGSFVLWECVDGSPTSGWRYCNPELNALYAAGRSTVDMDERTTVYQRMQQIFYEEVPAVNILVPPSVFGLASRVEGFTPTANIWVSSWNIHEWTVTE